MIIKSILKIQAGEATFTDDYDANVIPPGITYGVYTELIFDLRSAAIQDSRVLPPYELPEADSYYIAIDSDWLQETAPKLLRTSGIRVEQTEEQTLLFIPLPNTHKATGLADAIEASATKTLTLNCEIGGIKEGQQGDAFAFNFPLVIRNRIWLPGESTEPDPSDPDYLNTAQVQAFINAAIATALEDIQGDPGPAPVISIGEVSIGETAGVIVNEIAPGEYSIDFVFPEGEQGPKGSIAGLALGTITDGTEAEASINLVGETYILDLVLPRGKDGINPKGNWLDTELYNLNDAVRHNKVFWRSLIDDNLDNEPPSNRKDNQYWQIIVKDGKDAERLLRSYNTTDDISDSNWHSELQAGDLYFRDSIDGGLTWTNPVKISVAHDVIELYNIDNTTDWQNIQVHSNYSTGFGKFMRARRVGGEWGQAYPIHDLDSQSLRIQFAASSIEPDWHNELSSGDTIARFYNTTGTINQIIVFSDGTFDVDLIQLCTIPNPWHKIYDIDFDRYRKISVDGGLTWTDPMPLYGKSAYESWLTTGNSGTEQDFIESMRCTLPVGKKGQVLMLNANLQPVWGDLATYSPVLPPEIPEEPSFEELNLTELPDGVEKRIWKYLPIKRPVDNRELHLFWQSSKNGKSWGKLYSSATHGHCVYSRDNKGELQNFSTAAGPAILPVEYIPLLEIHVRSCWGYLDENNIWHKGDWSYHNTIGVKLSFAGARFDKPDLYNPEFFIIPIPDGTDQCEFRLSTNDNFYGEQVFFSNTLYSNEVKGWFFNGQDLIPATEQSANSLPVPFNAAAFEGQWFVFKRRGINKYNIRAIWTGDNPVIYEWSPEKAFLQKGDNL